MPESRSRRFSGKLSKIPRSHEAARMVNPHPTVEGSVVLVGSLAVAYLFLDLTTPTVMAREVGVITGAGIAASVVFDLSKGLRNLLRVDLLLFAALYFLTLVEFFFPQEDFNEMVRPAECRAALELLLIAFLGLALGRHSFGPRPAHTHTLRFREIKAEWLILLFCGATVVGYLHMLLAVNFDLVQMFEHMVGPRFSQPWTRGQLGDWKALLVELGLLLYLVPPLFGLMWNRRKEMPAPAFWVFSLIALFTLFQGFSSGTRNVFATYLASGFAAWLLTKRRLSVRTVVVPSLIVVAVLFFATYHMLEFRAIGLRKYLEGEVYQSEKVRETLFVDYNLYALAKLTQAIPQQHGFLGFEVPFWALVRPIPRALWPGKPEGLSVGIEEAVGARGFTVATTYVGEAYMMAGILGVFLTSVMFGALAGWWNRLGGQLNSTFSLVVYASGFFAASLTMRSLFWLTTAILPTLALIVFAAFFLQAKPNRRRRPRVATSKETGSRPAL